MNAQGRKLWILVAILASIFSSVYAQTNVSGYILSNTTWTLANSPYIVTGNILVNNGVTLTIEPGVTVKFDTTRSLQIDGELIAIGNAQNRITFTATDTTPAKGSWGRVQFSPNSTDAVFDTAGNFVSGSILKYCDIRYGGGVPGDVTVYCDTAAPYFSNCRISECLKHAVYFVNAVGRVDSSAIRNCLGTAISYDNPVSADLIVLNDTLGNNGGGISTTNSFINATIQHCVITNSGTAINIKSSSNTEILNNVFIANTDAIRGTLGVTATISDNLFTGHTNSVIGASECASFNYNDIPTLTATYLTITDNIIENNIGAIYVALSYYSGYCVIQGNTFRNNQFYEQRSCLSCSGPCNTSYCSCTYFFVRISNGTGGLIQNNVFDRNVETTGSYWSNFVIISGQWEIANNIVQNNFPGNFNCGSTPKICRNKFTGNRGTVIESISSSNVEGTYFHDNQFIHNTGGDATILIDGKSTIINNEFQANFCLGNSIISLSNDFSTVSNNRFLNNMNTGCPIISVTNSASEIQNNDFLNNTGLSCVRTAGSPAQPTIAQNNFVNPAIQYEVENQIAFGPGANLDISNNYWGTTDTTHIDSVIKDYFDDANLSVALYPPVLDSAAFVDTNASCTGVVCALSLSGTVVNASCYGGNNGSINLSVSNGTSPYTYVWSSGASTEDISSRSSGSYTVTVIDANFCSSTKSFVLSQPSSPVSVVSGVVTNANCNTGGSINISAGGGTSPYTYNWGSGITTQNRTGLNPGSYSVTVSDNYNCSATQSFTVAQDAGPIISGATTNTSCSNSCDGAIDVSVSGVAPFMYDWGTGFGAGEDTSGLCAGTYNVTVADSNNCGIAATFSITSPVALNAAVTISTDVSCYGYSDGAATATATGGTPPYSFVWSNGQTTPYPTGFSAGTYEVTVTDSNGCTDTASVTVPDGYHVFAGTIIGFNTAETGQSSLYSVNANSAYAYFWSVTNGIITSGQNTNGIEVAWTSAGTGLVQVIAQEQGCADTVSKSVTVIDTAQNCSAQFYLYPDTIPHSYFVINTASGIPQLSYSWNWGDGSPPDTDAYPTHTYNAAGFYTICLTITDSAGCTDTYCNPYFLLKGGDESSAMIQVNVVSLTFTNAHSTALENMLLYPNPTNGRIVLRTTDAKETATLKLFDMHGVQLWEQTVVGSQLRNGVEIDLKDVSKGIFFISIGMAKESRMMKMVKY